MGHEVVPFHIDVPDADIEDLRDRLRRTRWPEPETVDDWSQGTPLAYARELCRYWLDEYDWAKAQARLNRFPQFRTTIDGLEIHFVHVRSPHEAAVPLVITHGWPGSVVEFGKVIERLSNPVAFGGSASDAFHVVCPTLPGFGFSGKPARRGWGTQRIANAWDQLMARLGYSHYGAQGGDWGSQVTTALGVQHPEHVIGVHLNMVFAFPDLATAGELTDRETEALAALDFHRRWGSGYASEQSTRPQSLGYGLVDSPAGLCGWIAEKFWAWSDCDGDPANVFTRDEMLDNIMLYWLPGTGASAARLYWESFGKRIQDPVFVPAGASIFPKEIYRPSRRWAEPQFRDLRYWNELDKGGHFAAMEQPATFVDEVQAAFRLFR
ncbi:MAG TPA: epoxide hydrolase [Solirubrobacteraceae bacterium]|nr:epoxide hydrolase [Solirubrobacteraceae bacterium]